MYLISACLIGKNCKCNGKNNYNETANKLYNFNKVIPVCPEELGGLSTPRFPAEIKQDKVIDSKGNDVSKAFALGAFKTLEIAINNQVELAILQERSPSCGVRCIYDGTFTKSLIKGQGLTTQLLRKNHIDVITIDEYIKQYYDIDFPNKKGLK